METRSKQDRQFSGCGYEPPLDDKKRLTIWQPPSGNGRVGYRGPDLTVCAGYTVNLPEVNEIAQARAHWKVGSLTHFCDGETASEELLQGVLVFDVECSALDGWLMTPSKDGGGGS